MKSSCGRTLVFLVFLLVVSLTKAQELHSYVNRLEELRNDRSESLMMAVDEYKDFFRHSTPETADSAYVALEDFAVLLTRNIDFNLILLQAGNQDRSKRDKKAAADYADMLYRHYFTVRHKDGLIHVSPDLWRIQTELKDFLSLRTYAYFAAVQNDTASNGSSEILQFPPKELAARACFWEDFLLDTTAFLFREEAEQRLDACLEQLVFGSESYPVFGENGLLNEDYRQAYLQVLNREQHGKLSLVVRDYLKLIKDNDYREGPAVWVFRY